MLTKFLLAVVARSAASIVAFAEGLDAKLESILVQHDEEMSSLVAEISRVRQEAEARVAEIHSEIRAAQAKVAVVTSIKAALPTSTPAVTEG